MHIPFTKHTLPNGLDVLIHEDHALPIVAVNVWYHVGSKNEVPGRTGFAHLFEHLMFEGSQHYDRGYFHPLQEAGASLNGSTNADRTNYWEVVPTNALDRALWMESDRMGYLLPALTDAKFANQREVVLNERRQNYENRPYGLAGMAIVDALYPDSHPYHWLTIGGARRAAASDGRRPRVLSAVLPPGQCVARAGRRRRHTKGARARGAVLLRDPRRRTAGARPRAAARNAARGRTPRAGRPRGAAAAVSRVALSGALYGRRCRARSGRGGSVERQDVAPVSCARVRAAHRDGSRGVAEFPRAGELFFFFFFFFFCVFSFSFLSFFLSLYLLLVL
jgi:hypothetical protein